MLANEMISDVILPLRTSDSGNTAIAWMDELRVSHLPIVNNEAFLGLVSEKDVYAMNDMEEPLGSYPLSLIRPYVHHDQHLFEVLRVLASLKLSLVPVLDELDNYLGCITRERLLEEIAESGSINQPGGIIVLEMNLIDYSLHEISRIVESNDAKILHCAIKTFKDSTRIEVTLKLNKIDVSPVIQTFNRFDYHILASFSEENNYDELLRERFGSLMNYLNI
ncbi:MAG: CBS domain-containing protein [Bacteroidales bacterium]